MKLEIDRSHDSKGFRLRTKPVTLAFHCWPGNKPRTWPAAGKTPMAKLVCAWRTFRTPGFLLSLQKGKGAGYINGLTAFVGVNTRGGVRENPVRCRPFAAGVTTYANRVPYSFK